MLLSCRGNGGWADSFNFFSKFLADLRPPQSHCSRKVIHFDPRRIHAHLGQKFFQLFYFIFCLGISFQEMTLPFQSSCNKYAVNTSRQRLQHVEIIQFARAGQPDYFYIVRV